MDNYTIIENGRTERWHWIVKWCLNKQRLPCCQPWWLKGSKAWDKKNKL